MAQTTEKIQEFQTQFKNFTDNLSLPKKIFILIAMGSILVGLGLVMFVSQQVTYTPLVNGISIKETSLIAKKLEDSQIPYLISTGGTGILVDSQFADKAKLEIADAGLLNGGLVGFEIFDQSDLTATEFQQNVQFKRALEGELARLIQKINSIDSAKVMLSIPEESLFIDERKFPAAAVNLVLKNQSTLTPGRVKTIANLITGAVSGMRLEDVKISDQFGNLYLHNEKNSGYYETRDKNLNYQRSLERHFESKLSQQIDKITGPNGAVIKVTATINFDTAEIEEQIVDPEGSALVSEEVLTEKSTGSRSIPVGVPGVTSNAPEIRAGSSEVANISEADKRTKRSNFENSKRLVKKQNIAGEILRLSVSILLDDKKVEELTPEGEPLTIRSKWTPEEIEQIEAFAKSTVGFDPQRGDVIEVKSIAFAPLIEEKIKTFEIQRELERQLWLDLTKYVVIGLLVLLIVMVVVRPMVKKLSQSPEELNLIMGLPTSIEDLEREEIEIPAEQESGIPPRTRIIELAKQDPRRVASLVRFWLSDKKGQ